MDIDSMPIAVYDLFPSLSFQSHILHLYIINIAQILGMLLTRPDPPTIPKVPTSGCVRLPT